MFKRSRVKIINANNNEVFRFIGGLKASDQIRIINGDDIRGQDKMRSVL